MVVNVEYDIVFVIKGGFVTFEFAFGAVVVIQEFKVDVMEHQIERKFVFCADVCAVNKMAYLHVEASSSFSKRIDGSAMRLSGLRSSHIEQRELILLMVVPDEAYLRGDGQRFSGFSWKPH